MQDILYEGSRSFHRHTLMGRNLFEAAQSVAWVNGVGVRDHQIFATGFFIRIGQGQYFVSVYHAFPDWAKEGKLDPGRRAVLPDGKEIPLKSSGVVDLGPYLLGNDYFTIRVPSRINVPHLILSPDGGRGNVDEALGYVIGYPGYYIKKHPGIAGPVVSWGRYRTYLPPGRPGLIETDAHIAPGNSGSPLINSVSFQVEGIIYAQAYSEANHQNNKVSSDGEDPTMLGFVLPTFRLRDTLKVLEAR